MSRIRGQRGFTTIELLIALFVASTGIIALIGSLDMSRRLTTLAEIKESASTVAQRKLEQIRALDYDSVALDATPAGSTDELNPGYYVGSSGGAATYRWNQKAGAPTPHTENLVICAQVSSSCPEVGQVQAAAESWSDGRLSGKIYRYVTAVDDPNCTSSVCPGSADYKRVTVAVTVDQKSGPRSPILLSAIIADPDAAADGSVLNGNENPLKSPDTRCEQNGQLVDCTQGIDGTATSFYLYDTPATSSTRQEITASHTTRPTVAPSGTCTSSNTSGCPRPDLMGAVPAPKPQTTPPLYNYSTEITGGSWPGGAVIRRDVACDGSPTTTDNTKGHFWVTAPLSAAMTLTGDASLSLSTVTFNSVAAAVTLCVRFYDVPASITNLVASPATAIGTGSYTTTTWPTSATKVSFLMDFRGSSADYTIASGRRLGVRIWPAGSSGADIAAIYDHPDHSSFVQVNEAG